MKPSFSFNDAVAAPFVLLRTRPLYMFAWGLIMMLVTASLYALLIPALASMPVGSGDHEAAVETYMAESLKLQAAMNGITLVMYLFMLLTWTAVGRATLTPGRGDRFLFLRLGMDEVRVAVTVVALFVGWYLALIVLVMLGVGIGVALWGQGRAAVAIGLIGYGLVVVGLSIWGWVRVSLIPPATLVLGRFAFAEGWAIARRQVWKLIGLNVVVWVIYALSATLAYAVVIAILVGGFFGQDLRWPETIETLADLRPLVGPMTAPLAVALIPLAFGFGWMIALYAAPNIRAARQLLDHLPSDKPASLRDAGRSDALVNSPTGP